MFRPILCFVALVLATATVTAQTTKPAIMHERMTTLAGCLERSPDWVLTGAVLTGQKEASTYKLEGIGEARLLVLVGKKVEATGAVVDPGKPAAGTTPSPAKRTAAAPGQALPRFEATALREVAATCS